MKNSILIGINQVLEIYPVSKATLYRQIQKGEFPQNVKIGDRRVAWLLADVESHIHKLKHESSGNLPL